MKNIKTDKLNRKVCIRMTEEDFEVLSEMRKTQNVDKSKLLRNIISMVLDVVKKNNFNNKRYE